jgi:uncharacterized protein RhaS with RHS repeats
MHARYYNPHLGRFLSVDPVGGEVASTQSWNRYAYVRNNPLLKTDPLGRVEAIGFAALNNPPNTVGSFHRDSQKRYAAYTALFLSFAVSPLTVGSGGSLDMAMYTGLANTSIGSLQRTIDGDRSTRAFEGSSMVFDGSVGVLGGFATAKTISRLQQVGASGEGLGLNMVLARGLSSQGTNVYTPILAETLHESGNLGLDMMIGLADEGTTPEASDPNTNCHLPNPSPMEAQDEQAYAPAICHTSCGDPQ